MKYRLLDFMGIVGWVVAFAWIVIGVSLIIGNLR